MMYWAYESLRGVELDRYTLPTGFLLVLARPLGEGSNEWMPDQAEDGIHLEALHKVHAHVCVPKHVASEVFQLGYASGVGEWLSQLHRALSVLPAGGVKP